MPRRRGFLLCALPALSPTLLASDGKTAPVPAGTAASGTSNEQGSPAHFSWGDFDGDSRLDLAAVSSEGALQLLANAGEGRFEDVTERVGLAGIANAALALWIDYDSDGRLDLFVGARAGPSRLFRGEGGAFVDMTTTSGFASEGAVLSARWLDHDGDGRLDLHVVTSGASQLFRGLEGGFFEQVALPPLMSAEGTSPVLPADEGRIVAEVGGSPEIQTAAKEAPARGMPDPSARGARVPLSGRSTSITVAPDAGGDGWQPSVNSKSCMISIQDQARPTTCLEASSLPRLGKLFPISKKLFVDPDGKVGLGTVSPVTRLHISTRGRHNIIRLDSTGPSYGESGLRFRTGNVNLAGWNVYMDDSTLDELRDPDRLGFFHVGIGAVMVLDVDGSSGKVGIGKIDPSETLDVLGNICVSGGGMYLTCSDGRFKTNVADLRDALAKVLELRGVQFEWCREEFPEHRFSDEPQIGFIAQEVAEVLPEVVSQGSDGYYSVDYGKLTPVLVEAIQAQQEQIDGLLAANEEFHRAHDVLRERVERLESVAAEFADVKATLQMLTGSR